MADISKIRIPGGTEYDLKDAAAREQIAEVNASLQSKANSADVYTKTQMDTSLAGKVSTVNDTAPDASGNVQIEASALSMTAVNLLNTILSEAVYGTDQTSNIALLYNELANVSPVSISAVLNGTALAGQDYSELSFTVTATFDDDSTQTVENYTIVTTGTVTAGSNTVTIRYRGITTTCTFTAESVTTYSITYNLTNVTSSSNTSTVVSNSNYGTTLTVATGYELGSVTVTMGGVDVTNTVYSNLEILITEVTGNVVITATASQIVYLDPLLRTVGSGQTVKMYSDDLATLVATSYNCTPYISEYPAKYNCVLEYTFTNTSESAISLVCVGLGQITAIGTDAHYIDGWKVSNFSAIINSSKSLEAGQSISGTYSLSAGMQLVLTLETGIIDAVEIQLHGNFVAETFSDYTDVTYYLDSSSDFHTYNDSYQTRTMYSDDGSTVLALGGWVNWFDDNPQAGTYDVISRCYTTTGSNKVMPFGGFSTSDMTVSYYATKHITGISYSLGNLWYSSQMTLLEGVNYVGTTSVPSGLSESVAMDIRMKEANA